MSATSAETNKCPFRLTVRSAAFCGFLALTATLVAKPSLPAGLRGSAIDAHGVRHNRSDYPNTRPPPWVLDLTKQVAPIYSRYDRQLRHQGAGFYRLLIDLKTGGVRKIEIIKSTGVSTLDGSALVGLHQWRWKPNTWQQVELKITFALGAASSNLPKGDFGRAINY